MMGDEDFDMDDLFADFNNDDAEFSQHISDNLRQHAGLEGHYVAHDGDADAGRSTWTAPKFAGLGNSDMVGQEQWKRQAAEEAADNLWADIAPDNADAPQNISSNLLTDLCARDHSNSWLLHNARRVHSFSAPSIVTCIGCLSAVD